jgi:uncharacterized protein
MKIVLDTNAFLRSLMRPMSLATFVMAWEANRFQVVCSQELLDEWEEMLSAPRILELITPESLRAFRDYLGDAIKVIEVTNQIQICRDSDDDKVIATALDGAVDYIVSEDDDLYVDNVVGLLAQANIRVVSTAQLLDEVIGG